MRVTAAIARRLGARLPRRKAKLPAVPSRLEAELAMVLLVNGLPQPERQFRPSATRRYRADFCWPGRRLIVEVQGGVHVIRRQFEHDCERNNLLVLAGWRVLYVTARQIRSGQALDWIREALGRR